jgi:hypothetical protein
MQDKRFKSGLALRATRGCGSVLGGEPSPEILSHSDEIMSSLKTLCSRDDTHPCAAGENPALYAVVQKEIKTMADGALPTKITRRTLLRGIEREGKQSWRGLGSHSYRL